MALILGTQAPTPVAAPSTPSLSYGKLVLNPEQHTVSWNGQALNLTATEFAMLAMFLKHPTRVFSRDSIMDKAYDGTVYVSDRTIDSHIRHIRQKLAEVGCENVIETVHGVGYKLANCQ